MTDDLKSTVKTLPASCGVYLFKDSHGNIIYVGKSINLKSRVSSYFVKSLKGADNRLLKMQFMIQDVDIQQTDTELEALLLENVLIKKHMPEFNRQLRNFPKYCYLVLSDDEFPALLSVSSQETDIVNSCYGPFRDKFYAEDFKNLISEVFKIRRCTDNIPKMKCINKDMDICKAPCSNLITAIEYQKSVDALKDFLSSKSNKAIEKLNSQLLSYAEQTEFEKAEQLKTIIEKLEHYQAKTHFRKQFESRVLVIEKHGADSGIYIINQGNLVKYHNQFIEKSKINDIAGSAENYTEQTDSRYTADSAAIVYSWLKKNRHAVNYYFIKF